MDVLGGLLGGPRARDAFVLRTVLDPPWAIRVEDRAPLSVVAVTTGEAWIVPDGKGPIRLGPGAVAVVRGPEPYLVADDPDTSPQVIIDPGQFCRTVDGRPMAEAMSLGVRTWGNSADGSTIMLVGTYEHTNAVGQRILSVLPGTVVLAAEAWDCPFVGILSNEIVKDEPGQAAVLDRLLDLVLVSALRAWMAADATDRSAWYRAHNDPVVGHALRLLHGDVAHPWTVATLASATGVSRALLARRFTDTVGQPPMGYLTDLRLALAADRLLEPGITIEGVAREVGYGSAFALSSAFKRVRGISPRQHRAHAATPSNR
jgi:AraC-like DNA-binding protein